MRGIVTKDGFSTTNDTEIYVIYTKILGAKAVSKEEMKATKKVNLFTQKIESELQFKLICTAAQAKIMLSIG